MDVWVWFGGGGVSDFVRSGGKERATSTMSITAKQCRKNPEGEKYKGSYNSFFLMGERAVAIPRRSDMNLKIGMGRFLALQCPARKGERRLAH